MPVILVPGDTPMEPLLMVEVTPAKVMLVSASTAKSPHALIATKLV